MAGEDSDYPLSDGELSFSRWRSDNSAQSRVRAHAVANEHDLDFQSQFGGHLETATEPHPAGDATTHGSKSPNSPWDPNAGSVFVVSDQQFEKEFGFASPPDCHDRQHLVGLHSVHLGDVNGTSTYAVGADDEQGSHGSSELSFQDLVEGQEDELVASRRSVLVALVRTLIFIFIWYFFSTGLTIYNKKLLGAKLWDFPAPLLMNTVHFGLQAIVSSVLLRFLSPTLRPTTSISWKDYYIRVIPTAVATALDIDLTNASLVFISVSFETMCKSAAPVFLLLFAFGFKLEVPSFKLFGIILVISSGVLLTGLGSLLNTDSEDQHFELLGFVLIMLAAIMSGFRWTVTQVLLQKKEFGLNNPLAVMSQLAPVMAIITFLLSVATEPLHKLSEHPFFDTRSNAINSSLLLLLGGSLAFFMVLAEYLLISKTSAVTLTVAGVVKEVVTIVVAVIFLGDDFSAVKGVGLAVIVLGVSWFNWFKYQKFQEGKNGDQVEFERLPVRYVPLTESKEHNEEMHSF